MDPMRWFAAFLLSLLLPIQGLAAACTQICAQGGPGRAADHAAMMQAGESMPGGASHCEKEMDKEQGAGKCCKAHAFMIDLAAAVPVSQPPYHEQPALVLHWSSFIPEEPSPPPIVPSLA